MKNHFIAKLLALAVIAIISCKGDDPKEPDTCSDGVLNGTETSIDCGGECLACVEPEPTKTYYIKFKADGVWKIYETSDPGFQSCGDCACSTIPPLNESDYGDISICQESNDWIEAADIVGWDGEIINFTGDVPLASFYYAEGSVDFSSDNTSNQTSSSVTISNVELNGNIGSANAYKVTGTFNCKVAKSGAADILITEGEFVIKYTEDY